MIEQAPTVKFQCGRKLAQVRWKRWCPGADCRPTLTRTAKSMAYCHHRCGVCTTQVCSCRAQDVARRASVSSPPVGRGKKPIRMAAECPTCFRFQKAESKWWCYAGLIQPWWHGLPRRSRATGARSAPSAPSSTAGGLRLFHLLLDRPPPKRTAKRKLTARRKSPRKC
jgi:hypothetical protein